MNTSNAFGVLSNLDEVAIAHLEPSTTTLLPNVSPVNTVSDGLVDIFESIHSSSIACPPSNLNSTPNMVKDGKR